MVRGIERRNIFLSDSDRGDLLERIATIVQETGTRIYAWSLLPNHFHLLLRTGHATISRVMRRVLTGYAGGFNRRHQRAGHLFQNRFKSVLVEEEPYFLQLVRYIHLNPIRAGVVQNLNELDRWPWSGHATLMGRRAHPWQDTAFVLGHFGRSARAARRAYREFAADGIAEGRRPELTGGGLIRSLGGQASLALLQKDRERWAYDERILGSSEFVEAVWHEVTARRAETLKSVQARAERLGRLVRRVADRLGLGEAELSAGGQRKTVWTARWVVSHIAVRHLGHTVSEVARALGVSIQTVLRGMEQGGQIMEAQGWIMDEFIKPRK
jgi:REP element-mobilizing transposase RayT